MLGLPMRQALAGALKVFDFAPRDLAVPFPWNMVGGGNRTRRRIHEAVGPERFNRVKHGRTYSNAAWAKDGTGVASAPAIVSETISDPEGGATATRVTFALNGGATLSDTSMLTQYEPSGTTVGATYTQGLWANIPVGKSILVRNVGSSAYTELTGTGQWKRYKSTEISGVGVHLVEIGLRGGLPGSIGSDSATVDLWWSTLEDGFDLTPVVPNDGGTVASTTDWPRRNKIAVSEDLTHGDWTKTVLVQAQARAASWAQFRKCDVAVANPAVVFNELYCGSNILAGDYVSVFAAPAGWSYLVLGVYQGGDRCNVCFDLSNGTVGNVWGGIAPLDYGIDRTADGMYRVWIRSSVDAGLVTAFLASTNASNRAACYATGNGVDGVALGGFQVEADRLSAYMRSTPTLPGSSVAPPSGEIITVPAGQPRIGYGPDGIGRGFIGERASRNLFAYDGFFDGFDGPGVVTAIPGYRDENDGNTAFGIRCDTSSGVVFASQIVPTTTELTLQYIVRRGTHGTYGTNFGLYNLTTAADLAYVSIDYDTGVLTKYGPDAASMVATCVPVGVRGDFWHITLKYATGFAPGNYVNMYMGYVGNTGVPVGATHVIAWAQAEPGLIPTTRIKPATPGVVPVADAESLETFDLQALDLHSGRGTLLVDFLMPEVVSGTSHGIMSCCTGSAGMYMGIYTNGGQVIAACYYGGVRYEHAFTGFAAGDRVRAALTFDTGYFASAVNGAPGPVTYGNNPIVYDRVITGDLVGPRSYPADTTISLAATTGRVMTLGEVVGRTTL